MNNVDLDRDRNMDLSQVQLTYSSESLSFTFDEYGRIIRNSLEDFDSAKNVLGECKVCGSDLCCESNLVSSRFVVYCSNDDCKYNRDFMKHARYIDESKSSKSALDYFMKLQEVL